MQQHFQLCTENLFASECSCAGIKYSSAAARESVWTNDIILDKIAQYLPISALLEFRSVNLAICTAINQEFMRRVVIKLKDSSASIEQFMEDFCLSNCSDKAYEFPCKFKFISNNSKIKSELVNNLTFPRIQLFQQKVFPLITIFDYVDIKRENILNFLSVTSKMSSLKHLKLTITYDPRRCYYKDEHELVPAGPHCYLNPQVLHLDITNKDCQKRIDEKLGSLLCLTFPNIRILGIWSSNGTSEGLLRALQPHIVKRYKDQKQQHFPVINYSQWIINADYQDDWGFAVPLREFRDLHFMELKLQVGVFRQAVQYFLDDMYNQTNSLRFWNISFGNNQIGPRDELILPELQELQTLKFDLTSIMPIEPNLDPTRLKTDEILPQKYLATKLFRGIDFHAKFPKLEKISLVCGGPNRRHRINFMIQLITCLSEQAIIDDEIMEPCNSLKEIEFDLFNNYLKNPKLVPFDLLLKIEMRFPHLCRVIGKEWINDTFVEKVIRWSDIKNAYN